MLYASHSNFKKMYKIETLEIWLFPRSSINVFMHDGMIKNKSSLSQRKNESSIQINSLSHHFFFSIFTFS